MLLLLLRTTTTATTATTTKWLPRRRAQSWRTMIPRPLTIVAPTITITHHNTPTTTSWDSNAVGAVRRYHNYHHYTDIRFPNYLSPPTATTTTTTLSSMGNYQSDIIIITNHHISHPQYQQVRYKGRNDGNTHKHNTRKSVKKQQKEYHRHLQKQQLKTTGRHNPHNSKANLRRRYAEREHAEILNTPDHNDDLLLQPPSSHSSKYDDTDALLDDMMGNLTQVSPTPEPTYLGHLQSKYYTMVVDQMDDYFRNSSSSNNNNNNASTTTPQLTESSITNNNNTHDPSSSSITTTPSHHHQADLPTDELISQAVRAYRDRHGTHKNPIGLRTALQHVLYDLQVPLMALGPYTYTTLLTCCRSPTEGRRVFQMIQEQGLPISSYCYSILCHIHSKMGDYQGCINVHQEMLREQLSPTLVSYTSLLAACYKVSNNGRVAHPERAKAVQAGWEKWQEMRIIGIEPDVMAYGAILRLKASIGQAEECLSLLNEMARFQVYPTTLCYTTALQAVARSHATAIRYEKGISRRNRRREMITTHHGKLARQIVIMAENANFVPDEGFVSALCLCAGAAGDIATVKAIAVAYEILATQHDHLRTIGSNEHLQRLQGGIDPHHGGNENNHGDSHGMLPMGNPSSAFSMSLSSSMGPQLNYDEPIIGAERRNDNDHHSEISLRNTEFATTPSTNGSGPPHHQQQQLRGKSYIPPFAEREYGRDNRLLSSIIHACAQAVDPNMMGTIWEGRENKGYLCINSLRLIQQIKIPQYSDDSIPGQTITDNLKIVQEDRYDGYREGKRRPRKFQGVDIDENVASTMEEMLGDKDLTRRYLNPDGRRKAEYRKATPDDIWKLKYGDDWEKKYANDDKKLALTARMKNIAASSSMDNNDTVERSEDDMIHSYLESFDDSENVNEAGDDSVEETNQNESKSKKAENTAGDIYFDSETMRWKPISEQKKVPVTTLSHVSTKEQDPKEKMENVVVRDEPSSAMTEEEMYFDTDVMRWKTRPKIPPTEPLSRTVKSTVTQTVREPPKDRYESPLKSNEEQSDQEDDESDLSDDDDDGWESASDDSDEDEDYVFDKKKQEWVVKAQASQQESSASIEEMVRGMNDSERDENFELEFHYDKSEYDQELVSEFSDSSDTSNVVEQSVSKLERNEHVEAALYFDEKTQEWKMKNADDMATQLEKPKKYVKSASTNVTASIADTTSNESVVDKAAENEKAFATFYADLRRESFENEQEDVTEEEARELFDIMKDEYNEMIVMTPEELGLEDHPVVVEQRTKVLPKDEPSASGAVEEQQDAPLSQSFNEEKNTPNLQLADSFPFEKSSSGSQNADIAVNVAATRSSESSSSFTSQQVDTTVEKFWGDSNFGTSTQTVLLDPSYENHSYSQDVDEVERTTEVAQVIAGEDASHISSPTSSPESGAGKSPILQFFEMFSTATDDGDIVEDYRLERLREILPHFSDRRLVKIVQCYQRSLGDPSILELIPIVRENMPDYITSTWLKQMATMTAKLAIQKAAQNGLINPQILNSVLELHTSSGSLDRAIEFHQTEFAAHNLEPTEYSDRLIVQMLLRNNRFNRALDFKQTVQSSGRSLDIKAYGSLVEFCARRKQLGSALLLLKECLSTHGAAPGEASLSNLRILCRQAGIVDEIGLEGMIGTDPIEWLRQGEREKKREYSKKGRRNVQLARNVMLRV